MNIELAAQDAGAALVNIWGRMDAAASPSFKQQDLDNDCGGSVGLALHPALVSFRDSSGLGAMFAPLKAPRKAKFDISILPPGTQIRELARLTSLDGSSEFSKRATRPCVSSRLAYREVLNYSEVGSRRSEHGMIRTGRRSSPTISIMISLL
jgi:anti-anti-sigma regulatory factor